MFEIERDLYIQGKRYIIGIDEVGRGPLAGDVVAAAVCVDFSDEKHFIEGIRDSKKLSDKKRREMASLIRENVVDFSISGASPRVIDKINILQATILCMENALDDLINKLKKKGITPDIILVDSVKLNPKFSHISLNKGDDQCYSIGCASIIAKVYRDNLCEKWDEEYPGYGLKQHKGYGTKMHRESLVKLGPCEIHRQSFLKNIVRWKDESTMRGAVGEDKAGEYLEENGYSIIERNFQTNTGEIDLIATKGNILAFVEVKLRKDANYGYGFEAVDEIKQKKIKSAAEYYYYFKSDQKLQPRFDVIEIYTSTDTLNHFVDAFQ